MFLKLLEKLGRKKVVLDRDIIYYLEIDQNGFRLTF